MCMTNEDQMPNHRRRSYSKNRPKRSKVRVSRFTGKRNEERTRRDIELKNLKLYLENQTIIEENEKLRKKADLLHQENVVLLSALQKRLPHMNTLQKLTAGVPQAQLR